MSPTLEARDITKVYGHVSALSGANFDAEAGEILMDGKPVTIAGPLAARHYGIETVYQDLALAPHLNPVQNMYLGREIMRSGVMGRLGFMNNAEMRAGSKKAFDALGATVRNYS